MPAHTDPLTTDTYTLRQALATDYAYADAVGGFIGLNRDRRMRNTVTQIAKITGLTRDEIVRNARQDAEIMNHYCPTCGSPNAGSCPDCSFDDTTN